MNDKPELNATELHGWWLQQASDEVTPLAAKMVEYGGNGRAWDLIEIGQGLAKSMHWDDITEAQATELAIYFYVRGKMGRWFAAISEKRDVSDDTLYDIGIYIRMAQRVRAVGGWPV